MPFPFHLCSEGPISLYSYEVKSTAKSRVFGPYDNHHRVKKQSITQKIWTLFLWIFAPENNINLKIYIPSNL